MTNLLTFSKEHDASKLLSEADKALSEATDHKIGGGSRVFRATSALFWALRTTVAAGADGDAFMAGLVVAKGKTNNPRTAWLLEHLPSLQSLQKEVDVVKGPARKTQAYKANKLRLASFMGSANQALLAAIELVAKVRQHGEYTLSDKKIKNGCDVEDIARTSTYRIVVWADGKIVGEPKELNASRLATEARRRYNPAKETTKTPETDVTTHYGQAHALTVFLAKVQESEKPILTPDERIALVRLDGIIQQLKANGRLELTAEEAAEEADGEAAAAKLAAEDAEKAMKAKRMAGRA